MFRRGTERKRQRLVVDETEERTGRVFLAYGTPMTSVSLFWYLGQKFSSSSDNWPSVERNRQRVQGKWGRLAKILGRVGLNRRTVGKFYVAVLQMVILFRSKM